MVREMQYSQILSTVTCRLVLRSRLCDYRLKMNIQGRASTVGEDGKWQYMVWCGYTNKTAEFLLQSWVCRAKYIEAYLAKTVVSSPKWSLPQNYVRRKKLLKPAAARPSSWRQPSEKTVSQRHGKRYIIQMGDVCFYDIGPHAFAAVLCVDFNQ